LQHLAGGLKVEDSIEIFSAVVNSTKRFSFVVFDQVLIMVFSTAEPPGTVLAAECQYFVRAGFVVLLVLEK